MDLVGGTLLDAARGSARNGADPVPRLRAGEGVRAAPRPRPDLVGREAGQRLRLGRRPPRPDRPAVVSFTAPLVWPDGTVAPRHFAMGVEGWAPPEVCGLAAEDVRHDEQTAAWGLADERPPGPQGRPPRRDDHAGRPPGLPDAVPHGYFGRFGQQSYSQIPADGGIPHRRLPAEIRYLFDLAFRCGRFAPDQRPTVAMWAEALGAGSGAAGSRRRRAGPPPWPSPRASPRNPGPCPPGSAVIDFGAAPPARAGRAAGLWETLRQGR